MTLNSIVQESKDLANMLHDNGVVARFYVGNQVIDGFAIVTGGVRYVAIDTSFPREKQQLAAIRELSLLPLLQEGQSSLFLKNRKVNQ